MEISYGLWRRKDNKLFQVTGSNCPGANYLGAQFSGGNFPRAVAHNSTQSSSTGKNYFISSSRMYRKSITGSVCKADATFCQDVLKIYNTNFTEDKIAYTL